MYIRVYLSKCKSMLKFVQLELRQPKLLNIGIQYRDNILIQLPSSPWNLQVLDNDSLLASQQPNTRSGILYNAHPSCLHSIIRLMREASTAALEHTKQLRAYIAHVSYNYVHLQLTMHRTLQTQSNVDGKRSYGYSSKAVQFHPQS